MFQPINACAKINNFTIDSNKSAYLFRTHQISITFESKVKHNQCETNMISNTEKITLKWLLVITLVITVLFFIFSYFLAIPLGSLMFFSTRDGSEISSDFYHFPILLFFIFGFHIPVALNAGQVFLFLGALYSICLIAAWKSEESFLRVVRQGVSRPINRLFSNFLIIMPLLTSMLFIMVIGISNLQETAGLPTGGIPQKENPFETLLWLTYSPIMEEIGFRIIPFAIVFIVYLFSVRKNDATTSSFGQPLKLVLLTIFYPDKAKRMAGVKNIGDHGVKDGITKGEWVIVILTSFIFGLAHYISGGGWGLGKITTAFIDGLALALVYLIYGAYAPILLHWFRNYYLQVYYMAVGVYPAITFFRDLIVFATFTLGVVGWIAAAILGIRKLLGLLTSQLAHT